MSANSLNITFQYDNQTTVSQGSYLEVKLRFSDFEKNWDDNQTFKFELQ
jgi:hypothetical protein